MVSNLRALLVSCLMLSPLAFAGVEPAPAPQKPLNAEANYLLRCMGCHDRDGTGLPAAGIPDFNNYVGSFAATDNARAYLMHVPGVIGSSLTDGEIASVMNYIMKRWGGISLADDFRPFSAAEVATLRQRDVGDVVKFRRTVVTELKAQSLPVAEYPWP